MALPPAPPDSNLNHTASFLQVFFLLDSKFGSSFGSGGGEAAPVCQRSSLLKNDDGWNHREIHRIASQIRTGIGSLPTTAERITSAPHLLLQHRFLIQAHVEEIQVLDCSERTPNSSNQSSFDRESDQSPEQAEPTAHDFNRSISPDSPIQTPCSSPSAPRPWKRRFRRGEILDSREPNSGRKSALEIAIRRSKRSSDVVIAPEIGMKFDSLTEAYDFYNLYSWKIGFGIRYGSLTQIIEQLDRETNLADEWVYSWGKKDFQARHFYKFFFREIIPLPCLPLIWKTKCSMKHKVFAWLLMMDKLNTRDMSVRRQVQLNNSNCVICQQQRETRDHLFFDCAFSSTCWAAMDISWNMALPLSDRLAEGARTWTGPLFLEFVILAGSNIRKQRNRKHFDNIVPSPQSWLAHFLVDLDLLRSRVKPDLKTHIDSFVSDLRV